MPIPSFVSVVPREVKYARLRVSESGQVRLIVPMGLMQEQVDELYASKSGWVDARRRYFVERAGRAASLTPSSHSILLHGEPYGFFFRADLGGKTKVNHEARVIESGLLLNEAETAQQWYRRYANDVLPDLLKQMVHQTDISFNGRVYIRDSSTKWGNFSRHGNISLNWHLVLVPPSSAHYVVLHELLHTKTFNHSKVFWSRMKSYMPNYREAAKKLDDYVQKRVACK